MKAKKQNLNRAQARNKSIFLVMAILGTVLLGQSLLSRQFEAKAVYTMEDLVKRVTIETALDDEEIYEIVRDYFTAVYVKNAQERFPGLSQTDALQRALGIQQGAFNQLEGSDSLNSIMSKMESDKQFLAKATIASQDKILLEFTNKIINEVGSQKIEKEQSVNAKKQQILELKKEISEEYDDVSKKLPSVIPVKKG